MKVTESLIAEAIELLQNNKEIIAEVRETTAIGCSGCGLGCDGIVGG